MRTAKVRRHSRKTRNKVTTVRKHARKLKPSNLVKLFKNRYGIKANVSVKEGDYADAKNTSLAMTATKMKGDEAIDHTITLKMAKIAEENENIETLLHHELSHILFNEKNVDKLPEYKALVSAIKKTKTYKGISNTDVYGKNDEELFSRVFSQYKTGDTDSNDYLFTSNEMSKLKPIIEKLFKSIK